MKEQAGRPHSRRPELPRGPAGRHAGPGGAGEEDL